MASYNIDNAKVQADIEARVRQRLDQQFPLGLEHKVSLSELVLPLVTMLEEAYIQGHDDGAALMTGAQGGV